MGTFGFPDDALDPPDGGYPFIEWDDLLGRKRRLLLVTDNVRNYGFEPAEAGRMDDALESCATRDDAVDLLQNWMRTEQERREAVAKSVQERMGIESRYLKADPGEVKAVMQAIEQGGTGRRVEAAEPIPPWTCVWVEGNRIRGVLPGSMSNAITFDTPLIVQEGTTLVPAIWSQRVFVK